MVMQQSMLLEHSVTLLRVNTGRQSCIDAGAPLALTELAKEKAVKENSDAARWNVAYALGNIAKSDTGRQSCIDAGAPLALTNWQKRKL
jgi:hypothetical protein